jgi:hypothetical protein
MDLSLLRAWRAHRQGLDGSLAGRGPAQALEQAGWARSVGGVGPYLTLFARAGTTREAADAAVAAIEIHELPAARGCTYVVPASDFALALKVGELSSGAEMATAAKLGVTPREIDRLCVAVLQALAAGPLAPDALRDAVGGAVRSLGPDGVKKGLASTLPVALGLLQASGDIRRIPTNGRLDQQRYRYALWSPSPLAGFKLSADEANAELARRYFSWVGPAGIAEFKAFSGLSGKAAKAAVEPLGLVPLAESSDLLLPPAGRDALAAFRRPPNPHYTLVSSLDSLALHRREIRSLLDEADHSRQVMTEKGPAAGGSLVDLPSHAIIDRGRLVGLWEFDPQAGAIAWSSFIKPDAALKEAVARTEAFVRDQLGDARAFSLDTPKSRQPRIEALRTG